MGRLREEGTKYHLGRTFHGEMPLTPRQSLRLNAVLGRRERPDLRLLSPGQRRLLERVRDRRPEGPFDNRALMPVPEAWKAVEAWLESPPGG